MEFIFDERNRETADGGQRSRKAAPIGISDLHSYRRLLRSLLFWIASYKINTPVYDPASFHIFFDPARWYVAVAWAGAFALVSSVFILARFSFGYLVGFYLYTMVLGYLWLNPFTDLQYDHRLTALSAAASAVAFLLPALFITAPIRQIHAMTPRSFDRLTDRHLDTQRSRHRHRRELTIFSLCLWTICMNTAQNSTPRRS